MQPDYSFLNPYADESALAVGCLSGDTRMDADTPGKGEARMEPVDVDVLDNLINAQAAYIEAVSDALDHFEVDTSEEIEAATAAVGHSMAHLAGIILVTESIARA